MTNDISDPIREIRDFAESIGYTLDPRTAAGHRIGGQIHMNGTSWNIGAGYRTPHTPSVTSPGLDHYRFSIHLCRGSGFGGLLIREWAATSRLPFRGVIPNQEFVANVKSLLNLAKATGKDVT